MHTKEAAMHSSDDTIELYHELARRIAELRRAKGLSHAALAGQIGVPAFVTEIFENGILVPTDDGRFQRWSGCPFSREELLSISEKLCREIVSDVRASKRDMETVFFCPVTISRAILMEEIRDLVKMRNLNGNLLRQMVDRFGLKYRLLHGQLCIQAGREAADSAKRQLFNLLAACESRLRSGAFR